MKLIKILLSFVCALSLQAQQSNPKPHQCQENGKWGFADDKGNIVIPCKYDKVREFSNGFAVVTDLCKEICPDCDFSAGYICKEGAINNRGVLIVPIEYDIIEDFNNEGRAQVFKYFNDTVNKKVVRSAKMGFIDKFGKEIIPCIYTSAHFLNFWQISLNNNIGLIDKTGNILLPVKYQNFSITKTSSFYPIKNPIIKIKLNGKYGFADFNAKVIVTPRYDYIVEETDNYVIVKNGDKFGLLDKINGKEILPCLYNDITVVGKEEKTIYTTLQNTYFSLMINNKWGVANTNGKIIVPIEYDNIEITNKGFKITKDGETFMLNNTNF